MSPGCALLRHQKGWAKLSRGGVARPQESSQRTARPASQPRVDGNPRQSQCRRLRSPCGPLVAGSSLPLPFSLGDALAEDEAKALAKGSSFPLVSLIGNVLCSHGSRLSTLLRRLQRTRAAFLLVLHAGKCGLKLQSPRDLVSEPGEEASAVEP